MLLLQPFNSLVLRIDFDTSSMNTESESTDSAGVVGWTSSGRECASTRSWLRLTGSAWLRHRRCPGRRRISPREYPFPFA